MTLNEMINTAIKEASANGNEVVKNLLIDYYQMSMVSNNSDEVANEKNKEFIYSYKERNYEYIEADYSIEEIFLEELDNKVGLDDLETGLFLAALNISKILKQNSYSQGYNYLFLLLNNNPKIVTDKKILLSLIKEGVKLNYIEAKKDLAYVYLDGKIVEKDVNKAISMLKDILEFDPTDTDVLKLLIEIHTSNFYIKPDLNYAIDLLELMLEINECFEDYDDETFDILIDLMVCYEELLNDDLEDRELLNSYLIKLLGYYSRIEIAFYTECLKENQKFIDKYLEDFAVLKEYADEVKLDISNLII